MPPFNGSGVFSAPAASFPAIPGTVIDSAKYNAVVNDMASGLTTAITKDGQTTITANLPMATYRHTGVSDGTALTDYAAINQISGNSITHGGTSSGGTDTYAVNLGVSPGTYAAKQRFQFLTDVANTGACTVNFSGIGDKSIKLANGNDPHDGAIQSAALVDVAYDGTNFILLNPFFTGVESLVTKTELDVLSGATLSTAELNILDGATLSVAELNILSGATITTSKLNTINKKGADIASAATLVLGTDGTYFDVTGSTGPITSITVEADTLFMLQFDSTPVLTHHATNLNLEGGANITAKVGDRLIGFATAANQVNILKYTRADGRPFVPIQSEDIKANAVTEIFSSSGTFTVPAGVTSVDVIIVAAGSGGGGGGGYNNGSGKAGSGGKAGNKPNARIIFAHSVTPAASLTVTIGAGGISGTGGALNNNGGAGGAGGTTTFDGISVTGSIGGAGGVTGAEATASPGGNGVSGHDHAVYGYGGAVGTGGNNGAGSAGGDGVGACSGGGGGGGTGNSGANAGDGGAGTKGICIIMIR